MSIIPRDSEEEIEIRAGFDLGVPPSDPRHQRPAAGIAFVGLIAAIAIPSLLRARLSANEAQAIGDLRTVVSAEMDYAAANRDFFDNLACIAEPSACIPGFAEQAPAFPDSPMEGTHSGYQRTFHPGSAAALQVGQLDQASLPASCLLLS